MGKTTANNDKTTDRVKARILLPFTFVILLVIGAFVLAAYIFAEYELERSLQEQVTAAERLFRHEEEKDAAMMRAALIAIAANENIKAAYLEGDRKKLAALAQPLFDELHESNHITHFYFTRPDRVNFLRVHKPDKHGDTIDRITTLEAITGRQFAGGIELGTFGTLTLRVVMPWFENGRLIGVLELGEEVGHIIQGVHHILGSDLLALIDARYIDPQRWAEGKRMLGHENSWPRFGSSYVVGRAMPNIPEGLVNFLEQGAWERHAVVHIQEHGRDLYAAMIPITDAGGQRIGRLAAMHDMTSSLATFRTVIVSTALLSLLAGSIVFVLFHGLLGRVERDYQRQRKLELQLSRVNSEHQKAVQLEKLSAMGMMVGEIAHQLNNPLVGVVNMAQLAEREVEDPERSRELLREIGHAGKECHAFVKRMLEFTRLSHFQRSPTDLNHLLRETLSLFRQSTGEQAQVDLELPKTSPVLDIDGILVSHAVFNLLNNAVQLSPEQAPIQIRLFSQARGKHRQPGWCISVEDQGPGLSENILEKIYTPFFTTRAEGTGLGLTVVQHVAIMHEGEISVTNKEEGGAIFALWLPETQENPD